MTHEGILEGERLMSRMKSSCHAIYVLCCLNYVTVPREVPVFPHAPRDTYLEGKHKLAASSMEALQFHVLQEERCRHLGEAGGV